MSLRRFPWKAPRQSDNSFKLFSAPPSESATKDQETSAAEHRARHQSVPQDHSTPIEEPVRHRNSDASSSTVAVNPVEKTVGPPPSTIIRGPWRLLRLLPRESRHIIGRMLELKPANRATMEDIFNDGWIKHIPVCQQEEPQHLPNGNLIGGRVLRAEGHDHTLEKSAGGTDSQASSKTSKAT